MKWDDTTMTKLEMAFGKDNSMHRKIWAATIPKDWFVDYQVKELSYSDFVDKELVQFCRYFLFFLFFFFIYSFSYFF
jgi:hypothetical protein